MPVLLQLWFCVPLWIAAATVVSIWKAVTNKAPDRRTLWRRWAAVFGFAFITSLLWANPSQMIFYSGPFSGRVVDADSGKPVPVALLVFNWQGNLGQLSTHQAWTLTDIEGGYWLGWQGLGNWRIGAWPGPDSFYVEAPGYAVVRFFLDGVQRDPYGDHDDKAKSSTKIRGEIRLRRFQPNKKLNLIRTSGIPFGIADSTHRMDVARRFYDELFPRLCRGTEQGTVWEPTTFAFAQLHAIVSVIDPDASRSARVVEGLGRENGSYTPSGLDADVVKRLCGQLKLPDKGTR
ncbi:MAG: carboxypeptidase-like regulatory domain-containing protein [Tahibacter sp.]